ncbi:MAG: hypothetical protein RLZZ383_774 [Pseudomonadota bacterium]
MSTLRPGSVRGWWQDLGDRLRDWLDALAPKPVPVPVRPSPARGRPGIKPRGAGLR